MLTMTQVNRIRELYFEKGLSYTEVSRATGYDVKTVRKYVHQEDFNLPPPKLANNRRSKLDRYKKRSTSGWKKTNGPEENSGIRRAGCLTG
jgi:transposase